MKVKELEELLAPAVNEIIRHRIPANRACGAFTRVLVMRALLESPKQKDVAERLGISESQISRIVNGDTVAGQRVTRKPAGKISRADVTGKVYQKRVSQEARIAGIGEMEI